jgi:membrane-bound lytic murein transglycosylase B
MARHLLAITLAGCLLVGCSAREAPDRPDDRAARSPATSPTPAPDEAARALPTAPAAADPAVLARQLDRAAATVRDRHAPPSDVRRAGQLQQLAVHTLATVSAAFRHQVMARLSPEAAVVTRGAVRASRALRSLTEPEQSLPRWRIVAPPPAGELLGHYRHAQRRTGVPWSYLAAIHLVETRMGRIRGTSTAGARGPMQFLPSTWRLYGAGGDINDPRDAILAAARLLRDNGAAGDMAGALWHYNPSRLYVRAISEYARTMRLSESAYRGYWHWRVLYRHSRGTYVLPVGYPDSGPVLLRGLTGPRAAGRGRGSPRGS